MKFRWQDFAILGLILIFITTTYMMTKDFKSLPSPIYGGDYYYQLGCINNIKYGGNPLTNCQHQGGMPGYFPMYGMIIGTIAKIGISAMSAELLFSYFIIIGSILFIYLLASKIFDKNIGLIAVMLFEIVSKYPVWKYTDFTALLMMPLFFLSLYLFYKKQSFITAVFLGLASGISILSHSTTLFPIGITLCVFMGMYLFKNRNINAIKYISIIFILTASIGSLYWFRPLFVYHLHTSLHYLEWSSVDLSSFSHQLKIAFGILKELLFNFKTPIMALRTILVLAYVGIIFITKNKSEDTKFIFYLFIISMVSIFSYFITMPLLNINFIPTYIYDVFAQIPILLMACWSARYLLLKDKFKTITKISILSIILLLFIITQVVAIVQTPDRPFYNNAKQPVPEFLQSASNFIISNVDINKEVILSNKYQSFALNALTGRKFMVSRRSQNDQFLDLDKREIDAAIILFGNDSIERTRLLQLYNISYLYWDYNWISSEYTFNAETNATNILDPLMSFYSPENEARLKKYNISYFIRNTYVDPALRGEDFKTFDMILIIGDYNTDKLPFADDLISRLNIVWKYEDQGKIISALFGVKK